MAQDEEPITVYVSGATKKRLEAIGKELGREPYELALTAIDEAALSFYSSRAFIGDPTRPLPPGTDHEFS